MTEKVFAKRDGWGYFLLSALGSQKAEAAMAGLQQGQLTTTTRASMHRLMLIIADHT